MRSDLCCDMPGPPSSPPVLFITTFVTVFASVIAITKDLPDIEGDRRWSPFCTSCPNLSLSS